MSKFPEIEVRIESLDVDASNIEEKIKELETKRDNCPYNIYNANLWIRALDKQIDNITAQWSDPNSNGTAKLFYQWYYPDTVKTED